MSRKHRCCILECSEPENMKLFRFPTNNDLRAIWRRIIRLHNPDLYRSSEGDLNVLAQRSVCERHFELRYIRDSRRDCISIPTLFTEEEIASRTPTHPIELKKENLDPPWVLDTSTDDEESSLEPEPPVSEEPNVLPTSSDSFDMEQIWKRFPAPVRTRRSRKPRKATTSDGRSAARLVNMQQPRSKTHTPPITASGKCPDAGNLHFSGDQNENQTAVSDHNMNETTENGHSNNQTAVSEHCESQPAVNINVEDAVDDSQYLAGVDTFTGTDDECYNISDDDCQEVDDDSSFYHNVSKRSHDKDDIEMEPNNLDSFLDEDLHEGFKCNFCSGEIKGYRYTCVQCPDYDLCGSCEARGAHCLHYVLKIPRPKPYTEIQPLLLEIRRLLSGAHTDVLWTQVDEIKEEESNDEVMMMNDEVDPLDIDCVTPTLSEMVDNVPEMSTCTSKTKSHVNRQDNNDTVPDVTMQPEQKSHLSNALHTYTRHKQTVTNDNRYAASTSNLYPASTRLIASNRNTLLTRPQAIDKTRTPASESSQYIASTFLAPDGNTYLTIQSSPQAIDDTKTPASESSQYTASTRLAADGNTELTIESSPQGLDNTRTPAFDSSQYIASTFLAPDGKTYLTIQSSPQAIDDTRTPASESSQYTASTKLAPAGNTLPTIESSPQAIDNTRTPAFDSSQYIASTFLAPDGNTYLTIQSSPQAIDDTKTPASESSQYTASTFLAPDGNIYLTIQSSPQAIDDTRTPASESSQYTGSTKLAANGNTLPTIESSPQAIDNTRTPAFDSSQYIASTFLAPDGNTYLTIESSPQASDNTRTTVSESSIFAASTSVSSDGNTVLTIATNAEDTDSTSRPVPSTPTLYASASITPGDTETISNKIKITGDSRLQVPMATKRKYSDIIEASKPSQVVLLKGSKKFIVVPSTLEPDLN